MRVSECGCEDGKRGGSVWFDGSEIVFFKVEEIVVWYCVVLRV